MWWRRTTATLLGVSFRSYRRHRRYINGTSWIRPTDTSWWRTTEKLLGALFETCLRRRGDVLMGRRCYVLLRRRHDVPIRCRRDNLLETFHRNVVGCFIWDVPATSLGRIDRRHYDVATTSCCQVRHSKLPCKIEILLPWLETLDISLAFM